MKVLPRIRSAIFVFALVISFALPLRALTINLIFDTSVTSLTNATQVEAALGTAAQILQSLYTNAITVNITNYWGSTGSFAGGSVSLGISQTEFVYDPNNFKYPQLTNALRLARTTRDDSNSVASLPASDPTGGSQYWLLARAEAKAMGLLGVSANNTAGDGEISFATNVAFTFDPNNRAVSGKYDFIGVALHEMTEVLGRDTFGLNGSGYNVIYDLFRFTGSGVRSFDPAAPGAYFSTDNGVTALKSFNSTAGGDLQDWATSTPADSFDAFVSSGHETTLSAADLTALDVVGFKLNYQPPRMNGIRLNNGTFQLNFTNTPGTTYSILTSTNVSLALTNWTTLGTTTEILSGQFQFTDTQASTNKLRFYRARLN